VVEKPFFCYNQGHKIMKISYRWLQSYFNKPLPDAQTLEALFNAHAFEVEGVEVIGDDTVLDIKTLADRNHYALCHRGIAREAGVIARIPISIQPITPVPVSNAVSSPKVNIEDSVLCRRYVARRIEGLHITDTSAFKQSLEAIGSRSINSVVDATNFVMFDIGQPLHAFDADKIKGAIQVRKAYEGETMTLLDGREITLKETDLLIADDEGPLVVAGVKGGKRAEVTTATKNIILESANFQPTTVRRTSTRLNLRNDSSKRFENEITPDVALEAMERVTALITQSSPGAYVGPIVDVYPQPVKPWTITYDPILASEMVGMPVTLEQINDVLDRLNFKVVSNGAMLNITPPLDRLDVTIPEDISDEIARLLGYSALPPKETPDIPRIEMDKTFYWGEKVKNILVSLGFSETLLYTLVPKGSFEIWQPLASDKAALRERIAPKLIDSLVMNSRNADILSLDSIKVFEIGKVFPKSGEKTMLAIGVTQIKKKKGVTSESVIKETVSLLEKELTIPLEVQIENGEYGSLIEIDFDALVSKLPSPSTVSELGFTALAKELKYQPFSHYPFMTRDIAVFVPKGTEASAVLNIIVGNAGNLLVKYRLFDVFTKSVDGVEKTSYAYRLIFQSFERTLLEEDVSVIMEKITKAMHSETGWQVR
jgi:phenylalanyl-tRNA synthetase beta chain